MNPILAGVIFVTAFVAAWVGVGLFRGWSLRREIFDVPNERSSHTEPTPRGGGVVIVAVTMAGYVLSTLVAGLPISYGYVAGALLISLISWFDDLVSIPFWARLAVHIAGSALVIADIGYWQEIFIPTADITIPFGPMIGAVVTMGWLVWFINAYNFMDGIDGIAGIQAVVAGIAWAILSVWMGLDGTFLFAGILACTSLGFLMHNWAPAKIFMGDVGSAYLGFTLAAIPLLARTEGPETHLLLPAAGILFVWYFIFDSVFTLCRRLLLRQRVWEAHREHIYQRMVISGWNHATVTLVYGVLAVILSATVVLAIIFSGKFVVFAILSILIPTLALVYFGIRKKD